MSVTRGGSRPGDGLGKPGDPSGPRNPGLSVFGAFLVQKGGPGAYACFMNAPQPVPIRPLPLRLSLLSVAVATVGSVSSARAQDYSACFPPAYSVQRTTIMEPTEVTRYRLETKTEMREEERVSYRPVWKTRMEERTTTVAKPVVETSYREETYVVQRPVVETSYREQEVQRTRYVEETAQREQTVTRYRPQTETSYRTREYEVQRPVSETEYYDQTYAVNRPTVETEMRRQRYQSMRPVTTYEDQVYDAGGYEVQQSVAPGGVAYRPAYVPGTHVKPGPLGLFGCLRGSYTQVPVATPPVVQNRLAYRPNYVTQRIARTSYRPEINEVDVPVQVRRMRTEYLTRRIPVTRTRMERELVSERIPVQTTRMVPVTETRRIPYTVRRPVVETKTRRIPIKNVRYESETRVRKVPVTTRRVEYETRTEEVPVRYMEQERIVRRVQVPVKRQVCVPYKEIVNVPRTVTSRPALSYTDPFSAGIVGGLSTIDSSMGDSSIIDSSSVVYGDTVYEGNVIDSYPTDSPPTVVQPNSSVSAARPDYDDDAVDSPSDGSRSGRSRTRLRDIESRIESDGAGDIEELPAPRLNGPTMDAPASDDLDIDATPTSIRGPERRRTPARMAGWRVRWRPELARRP